MNKINCIGEGCKPIFDREELKKVINQTNEMEERRIRVAIDEEQSVKSCTLRRRSLSSSPIRNRVYSGYSSSYQSSHRMDLKHQDNKTEICDTRKNNGRSDLEKEYKEYEERYTEGENKHDANRSRSREARNSRSFMEERSYHDRYRERSNEHSHERRDRDRDTDRKSYRERDRNRDRIKDKDRYRERRDIAPHYIESPIPVPIYYGNFPPRPIVVSPMVPLRGQIPPMGRGRHPALMTPIRPFPPRFPPDMYRLGHPPLYVTTKVVMNARKDS